MKAQLIEDIIQAVGAGDTEIGALPPGVGVERLRWDGATLIDLAEATQIHVRHISGKHFELHCMAVVGSQPVTMTWADRKNLIMVDGLIRLKTAEELYADYVADYNGKLKAGLRQNLCMCINDTGDQMADTNKMIYLMTEAICGDATAMAALQELLLDMRGIYPIVASKEKLKANAVALKTFVPGYYAAKL